jgi:predicted nucleotidyltransferase
MFKIPTEYFTFIIAGSYASNKQTEHSDLDIVIICDDTQDTKHILAQIRQTCELSIPHGHPYIFTKSEFLGMLLNVEANYGKEIVKNNLIIYGAQQYLSIINEAMQHGFNDKKLSGKGTE